MIVKMTKYRFLVYHAQYAEFLERLRTLGILHVTTLPQGSEAYEALRDKFTLETHIGKLIETCEGLLKDDSVPQKTGGNLTIEQGMELVDQMTALQHEEEKLTQAVVAAEREVARMAVWGDYSLEKVVKLQKAGYTLGFYTCQVRNYNATWEEAYNAYVIENSGNTVHFVTVTNEPITDIDAELFKMSELSSAELAANVTSAKEALVTKKNEIVAFAQQHVEHLKALSFMVHDEINLCKINLSTTKTVEDKIMVLEGYCPDELLGGLNEMLTAENIYYEASTPSAEDEKVPIKLRNNWFTRLFEPLTGMYGIPSYQEYDPTPILAPFFLLFFAMCMGDAGYGILLILFGLAVKFKKISIEMFDGLGNIITVLGIGTLVVGFFLGTAFGVPMASSTVVPESWKSLMIVGKIQGYDIQMALAIVIGIVHICLALIVKAVGYTQRFGFKENISTWGWLLLILGSLCTAVLTLAGTVSMEAAKIAMIAIGGVSALGIYIFNDPNRNILINVGAGLWDTYNMATGLLGDVLSYIRLYALGLAGGMLGGAFNTLGLMVLGEEPSVATWIPFVIILLLGHTLNIAMSALGAFVHPLRLSFVEYFKNAGYEGKGEKYEPLKQSYNAAK